MSEALGDVEAAVSVVVASPLWSLADADVVAEMCRVFAVVQRLSSRFAALVGEAGSRGVARQAGAATPTAWLADVLAMSGAEAHRWVKLAGLLRELPLVAEALAGGGVSVEAARVVAQTVHDLPAEVGDAGRQRAVEVLTKLAVGQRLRPEVLARHREEILDQVAPEVAEERARRVLERAERSAFERRGLTLSAGGEGEYRLRGVLTCEAAAIVRAALEPLCAPGHRPTTPTPTPTPTPTATATAAAAATAMAAGGGPATGAGGVPDAEASGGGRSAAARRADALVEICRRILDGGELPESGGEKPHLVVTMSWEQLRDQVGAGLLDTGDLLTPATVRRLACDAQIIPTVLGGDGQVLDVGRARRLIDGPLRRALVLRDNGCAWPGCDRPPRWCHGHHVHAWHDGGPTSLDNSVLLCGFHHREIHRGWWQVTIAADGHPQFTPPAYIDPDQTPIRNTLHRRC